MLSSDVISEIARDFFYAERDRSQVRAPTIRYPDINMADAYAIQKVWVDMKVASGNLLRGYKIGLTSRAMQMAVGIDEPDHGVLLEDMFFESGSTIPIDRFIAPRLEVELAFVIGKRASYVEEDDAMDHVAGYLLHNDYSERDFQLHHGGQWVKGKSADTFAPLGPWLVTRDEIADPHNLRLWLKLNGETVQVSSTSDMIFTIPQLVSYISRYMTLLPGDIISTGTPEGVGMGRNPQVYLKPGDVVELGIEGLGSSSQEVKAPL